MGLAKRENVLDDSSDNSTPITSDQIATSVSDTFINKTALSPDKHPEIFGAITSYVEGSPVIVEYFKLHVPYINKETMTASFSLERAAARSSYDLIHNFEFKLQDQLDVTTDPDTNELSITGTCITYTGFKPNVGDVFLFKLPADEIGVFVVNNATPLSIHRGTNYRVEFHLYSFITDDINSKLMASVSEEMVFDKQMYFSDEVTLLKVSSYTELQQLRKHRDDIVARQFSTFYSREQKTFMRGDMLYDPFVIEFWNQMLSITDYPGDTPICQISTLFNDSYGYSIWNAIIRNDLNALAMMSHSPCTFEFSMWDSNLSAIDKLVSSILRRTSEDDVLSKLTIKEFVEDPTKTIASYAFTNRLYMGLMHTYESGEVVVDIDPILTMYENDARFSSELLTPVYMFNHNDYIDLATLAIEDITNTSSNNDAHIPDGEFMIYDLLVNDNVDTSYLLDTMMTKFPFVNMTNTDKFYYYPVLLHIIDVAIHKLR